MLDTNIPVEDLLKPENDTLHSTDSTSGEGYKLFALVITAEDGRFYSCVKPEADAHKWEAPSLRIAPIDCSLSLVNVNGSPSFARNSIKGSLAKGSLAELGRTSDSSSSLMDIRKLAGSGIFGTCYKVK